MSTLPPNRRAFGLALAALAGAAGAPARALEAPAGAVVLTVRGRVAKPNRGTEAVFDMAMIERLPQAAFTSRTPWYTQARKFSGPLLRDVLAAAGARGRTVRAFALNDYRVDIPYEDAQVHDMIVARLLDDQPMAVRDKGPLFILYPFDSKPELRSAVYYARSAWQLKTLEVL